MFKINIHSFVDVITNSSTTTYVKATQKSIDMAKELVNAILKIGNSNYKADDLFIFELENEYVHDWRENKIKEIHTKEFNEIKKYDEKQELISKYWNKYLVEQPTWWNSCFENNDPNNSCTQEFIDELGYYPEDYNVNLIIIPKNKENCDTNIISVLSSLTDLFECDSSYDG